MTGNITNVCRVYALLVFPLHFSYLYLWSAEFVMHTRFYTCEMS